VTFNVKVDDWSWFGLAWHIRSIQHCMIVERASLLFSTWTENKYLKRRKTKDKKASDELYDTVMFKLFCMAAWSSNFKCEFMWHFSAALISVHVDKGWVQYRWRHRWRGVVVNSCESGQLAAADAGDVWNDVVHWLSVVYHCH